MTKEQKILLTFVLLAVGGGVTFYVTQQKSTPVPQAQAQAQAQALATVTDTTLAPVSPTTTVAITTDTPTIVSNQTYTEVLTYKAPENHTEEITVTAIVDAMGNIVDVTFTNATPSNRESKQYLGNFAKSFSSSMVIGKNIHSVNLSRVGGASLTTGAFNKAITNIGAKVNG